MKSIVNVAAYKFVRLSDLPRRRQQLRQFCRGEGLKGTILLSPEGINLFVAGERESVDALLDRLRSESELSDLQVKESLSEHLPFRRMLVKIKREIISFDVPGIDPAESPSPKISPRQLKSWLDQQRPLTLLDVRNDYEVELGSFENARPIGVAHFRNFPGAVKQLPESLKQQPIVMFCTGGIRCEKAGPYMQKQGFREVFQLDGGILKYFEECGGEHFRGECFVFDQRVGLDSNLDETDTTQCYACQAALTVDDQRSPMFVPGESCPYCYRSKTERMQVQIDKRHEQIRRITQVLPGCVPYENCRPMNVPANSDGATLLEFLATLHPQVPLDEWRSRCQAGRLVRGASSPTCQNSSALCGTLPLQAEDRVQAGQRIEHLIPHTIEPEVNADIRIQYEDSLLVVVDKPAPLPMHPCGRFNRNTLIYLLNEVYRPQGLRLLHRLDANTTGVVVLARTRKAASLMQPQFALGKVSKQYLARVHGCPENDEFFCDEPISPNKAKTGARQTSADGLDARTEFRVLWRYDDGTVLVQADPITGRTNQIRIHLAHLGWPVCGDPTYGKRGEIGGRQTLRPGDPPLCLHARRIQFRHPETMTAMTFEAPLPDWAETEVAGIDGRNACRY